MTPPHRYLRVARALALASGTAVIAGTTLGLASAAPADPPAAAKQPPSPCPARAPAEGARCRRALVGQWCHYDQPGVGGAPAEQRHVECREDYAPPAGFHWHYGAPVRGGPLPPPELPAWAGSAAV